MHTYETQKFEESLTAAIAVASAMASVSPSADACAIACAAAWLSPDDTAVAMADALADDCCNSRPDSIDHTHEQLDKRQLLSAVPADNNATNSTNVSLFIVQHFTPENRRKRQVKRALQIAVFTVFMREEPPEEDSCDHDVVIASVKSLQALHV